VRLIVPLVLACAMLANFNLLLAQSTLSHRGGFGVFGTRKSLVNYLDYGLGFQKFSLELALGYELGRALQYRHFAPAMSLGLACNIVEQEKIHLDLKSNFLFQRNQYPSNNSLVSRSFYLGYELRLGNKIQFSQRLLLGVLHNQALSGYSKLSHDFMFSAGVHYYFLRK
jgi:hypothetical protein